MSHYYLDENKNAVPCNLYKWAQQIEDMSKIKGGKHVANEVINGKRISTVWLGLDHQWMDGGKPLIFETMVFNDGGFSELYMDRYSTWQEAEEGHAKAVKWVKDGCKDE